MPAHSDITHLKSSLESWISPFLRQACRTSDSNGSLYALLYRSSLSRRIYDIFCHPGILWLVFSTGKHFYLFLLWCRLMEIFTFILHAVLPVTFAYSNKLLPDLLLISIHVILFCEISRRTEVSLSKLKKAGGGSAGARGICSEPMELLMRQVCWKDCEFQRSTLKLKRALSE